MLKPADRELLARVHQYVPKFEKFLEEKLQIEMKSLVMHPLDKVQITQGKCVLLQELLAELRTSAGI